MEMERVFAKVAIQMGYAELRPKLEEVILHFVSGNDIIVSVPTESGKSLHHSLLPGVFDKVRWLQSLSFVIVVSPLAALRERRELWRNT